MRRFIVFIVFIRIEVSSEMEAPVFVEVNKLNLKLVYEVCVGLLLPYLFELRYPLK